MHQNKKTFCGEHDGRTNKFTNVIRWVSPHRVEARADSDADPANRTRPSREKIPYSELVGRPHTKLRKRLNKLHSIPIKRSFLIPSLKDENKNEQLRKFSYSIPLVCMLALFGILACAMNNLGASLDGVYAVGEDDDISTHNETTNNPTATLEISTGSGSNGGGMDESVYTGYGMAYRSHDITVNVEDVTKYSLQLSYASGSDKLRLQDSNAFLFDAGGKIPDEMEENSWGFAWGDTTDSDSEMTYYTMPQYNTVASDIASGLLASQDTYSNGFTKKLVFGAKFGSNATAGHYTAGVVLSLTASPKDVATTISNIFQMQQMTPEICQSTKVGEKNTLIDIRDNASYTVEKLKDGNCWMTQNLRLESGVAITNENSDITAESYTIPSSIGASDSGEYVWNSVDEDYGAYYSWCAATAGTCASAVSAGLDAPSSICPKGWTLPSNFGSSSYQALYDGYDGFEREWINNGGVNGDKGGWKLGDVFFPAAGYYNSASVSSQGSDGFYWSRTSASNTYAYNLRLNNTGMSSQSTNVRRYGFSVRCVATNILEEAGTMQNVTTGVCAKANVGDIAVLRDERDGRYYMIAKIKNAVDDKAHCWMTSNLDFDVRQYANKMTPDFSDVTIDKASWALTTTVRNGGFSSNLNYATSPSNTTTGTYKTEYGYYYTWCTATAGSCSEVGNSDEAGERSASMSICPKGWKLPTGGAGGQFEELFGFDPSESGIDATSYVSPSIYNYFHCGFMSDSGLVYTGNSGKYSDGRYWSSSSKNGVGGAYSALFSFNTVWPIHSDGTQVGDAIRCVATSS